VAHSANSEWAWGQSHRHLQRVLLLLLLLLLHHHHLRRSQRPADHQSVRYEHRRPEKGTENRNVSEEIE
jgi:hypothetical protein